MKIILLAGLICLVAHPTVVLGPSDSRPPDSGLPDHGPSTAALFGAAALEATLFEPGSSGAGRAVDDAISVEAIQRAVARSVPFLRDDGQAWFDGRIAIQDGQGCVSCHQVPFGIWGLNEAQRAGVAVPIAELQQLREQSIEFLFRPGKGRAMSWGPLILGRTEELSDGFEDPERNGDRWAEMAALLLAAQHPDGYWAARGQFPSQDRSLAETDSIATLWSLLALAKVSGWEVESLSRALAWLESTGPGETTEWLMTRLLVDVQLERFGAADDGLHRLLEQQNRDGGWGWRPGQISDSLTTGQVLYALAILAREETGVVTQAAVQAAVSYLLETQGEAGRWTVASELISEEGDEAKDYIYDYWGTAWATIGLARSVPSHLVQR